MKAEEKCELLADTIRAILSSGIRLSSDVVHYIDSTFSNPTIAELQGILEDDANCEKDPLMELLFFPDETMQLQLEVLLESHRFQKQDQEKILHHLYRQPLQITIHLPHDRGALSLEIPEPIADQFLSRLNISRQLDPKLVTAINKFANARSKNQFKVRLRNSRFATTDNKVQFLCGFFDKMDPAGDDVLECLDFVLGFLDELQDDTDLFKALMAKKKFYFKSLQMAKKLDDQLQKNNMETLLLQGKRISYISKDDAYRNMALIDKISLAVCGKTEYFDQYQHREDLGPFDQKSDLDKLIKSLI